MANGSLMKDLHLAINGLENQFWVFFLSGHLRQVLLYILKQLNSDQRVYN